MDVETPRAASDNHEILKYIHTSVVEMVRFAEAKNGALFAANLVVIPIIYSAISTNSSTLDDRLELYGTISICLLLLSTAASLVSFVPILRIRPFRTGRIGAFDNLLHFNDIATYEATGHDYRNALAREFKLDIEQDNFALTIAHQIVANATIAQQKFVLFTWSIIFFVLPLMPVFVALAAIYLIVRATKALNKTIRG